MTPEEWRRIRDVLASVLERPKEQRESFLDGACGEDAALRRAVESLLSADAEGLAIHTTSAGEADEPKARPRLEPGARLGPYEVRSLLGQGGMGEVYRAHDPRLGRDVAIKTIVASLAADPGVLARFQREAAAIAALSHPSILAIHDIGLHEGVVFFVMELLDGETLRQRLSRGVFPWREAVALTEAVAQGLSAAHARGIVHRDVKPENLFLTSDGGIRILDFGLARQTAVPPGPAASSADPSHPTAPGAIIGTLGYLSPEQIQGRAPDQRSDIFALGCVLFEMLTGQRPFQRPSAAETMAAVLRDPPRLPSDCGAHVPPGLDRLVARCLEKAPSGRFSSARDLASALRDVSAARTGDLPASVASRSVAVLPFLSLSADPESESFADGVTEDVIAHLAKIRSLKVISRTSVLSFKGERPALREIGRTLGAATVLDGTVRRSGARVRIVAQLLDAETDAHLWAETYDRELTDIFAIQTDVALHIADALRAELSADERSRIGRPPTLHLRAYQLYVQGRHCFNKYTEVGIQQGIRLFGEAIAEDPGFALAFAGLARAYAELTFEGFGGMRPAAAHVRAEEAIAKALALDDRLGEAHGIAALLRILRSFDWVGAEREFDLALELSPGSADIHDHYGWMCAALERYDDALDHVKRAGELDPLAHRSDLASTLLRAGRYEEAFEAAQRVVELEPSLARGYSILGWAHLRLGRPADGLMALERAALLSPGSTMFLGQLGEAYAVAGREQQARDVLRRLHDLARQRYVSPYHFAYVHAGLGEDEEALDWLERAHEERSGAVYGIKGSFLFASLRPHPRFQVLLRKMNLAS